MLKNLLHIFIWCLYVIFLFAVFTIIVDLKTAVIRTSAIIILQIVVFYSNLKWILPQFYESKKYGAYILINLIFITGCIGLNSFIDNYTPYYTIHNADEHEMEVQHFDLEIILINILPLILAIFISFFLYTSQKRKQEEKRALALITAEKQFLVQQINPHFLFNALNNIYFLTYKTSPKGSAAIIQLSKMLDYSLYGEKQESVILKEEITYINNFIDLFKLKDSEMINITFDYSKADTTKKIAPLLLIPFVENAFKHSNIENVENGFILIKLSTDDKRIIFECINSYEIKKTLDSTNGIGIKNVKRRLDLLYNNKHNLNFDKTKNLFSVHLKINTNA